MALRALLYKMRVDGPGSFLHHDEDLRPESYYSNTMGALLHMMRAYALRVITLTR